MTTHTAKVVQGRNTKNQYILRAECTCGWTSKEYRTRPSAKAPNKHLYPLTALGQRHIEAYTQKTRKRLKKEAEQALPASSWVRPGLIGKLPALSPKPLAPSTRPLARVPRELQTYGDHQMQRRTSAQEPQQLGTPDWCQTTCSCGWEGPKHYEMDENWRRYAFTDWTSHLDTLKAEAPSPKPKPEHHEEHRLFSHVAPDPTRVTQQAACSCGWTGTVYHKYPEDAPISPEYPPYSPEELNRLAHTDWFDHIRDIQR